MTDDDEFEDDLFDCPECGELTPETELEMHYGMCKSCYDDHHFGEDLT